MNVVPRMGSVLPASGQAGRWLAAVKTMSADMKWVVLTVSFTKSGQLSCNDCVYYLSIQ